MSRKWVVNASPLITLAKISHLDLIEKLSKEFFIPEGVAIEIQQGPGDDPAKLWLENKGNKFVKKIGEVSPLILAWDLGLGESEVLTWTLSHPKYEAIVDDRAARNCAQSLGIKVKGTIGIILLAKKEGMIPAAKPVLNLLVKAGLRINPNLLKSALKLVNE